MDRGGAGNERDQEADKERARDDILGGIPSAVIAGLFQTCTIKGKDTSRAKVLSVQNRTVAKPWFFSVSAGLWCDLEQREDGVI